MLPPAPARLSTTTGWPRISVSCCPVRRAMMSAGPPGAKGITKRTGLAGQVCACADVTAASASAMMQRNQDFTFFPSAEKSIVRRIRENTMTTRRDFLSSAGTLAGLAFVGCDLLASRPAAAQARRQTIVAGRRAMVIDVHAHCAVPEALALMGLKIGGPQLRPDLVMATSAAQRI